MAEEKINIQNQQKPNYALTKNLKYSQANSAQKEIFNIFDINGNKVIDDSEFETFQKNFGTGEVSSEAIDEYIDVFENLV